MNQPKKFKVPSFNNSKDMIGGPNVNKMGNVTLTTPTKRGSFSLPLDLLYTYTKFDDYSFSCSRDMISAPPPKNQWFT